MDEKQNEKYFLRFPINEITFSYQSSFLNNVKYLKACILFEYPWTTRNYSPNTHLLQVVEAAAAGGAECGADLKINHRRTLKC